MKRDLCMREIRHQGLVGVEVVHPVILHVLLQEILKDLAPQQRHLIDTQTLIFMSCHVFMSKETSTLQHTITHFDTL